ncbi:MAG: 23S rRNA (pseudouridine(1915)-N(3))-methyltransferase RlmH [Alphaproteobacteria bacterium]|nr:23S rRNA (pseudouridine(1915)-N(3))-methyltransferase RlmH [Alphaproteobacteria bacterium]
MKITLLAVGKMKQGAHNDLCQEYIKRLTGTVKIIECTGHTQAEENEALLAKIDSNACLIVLDERGDSLKSVEFASFIERQQNNGQSHFQCVIGGADGLLPEIREKAHLRLALGKLTWPHMLVRVMLLEQLYRAQQILGKHPYHRE